MYIIGVFPPRVERGDGLGELPRSDIAADGLVHLETRAALVEFAAGETGADALVDEEVFELTNRGHLERGHEIVVAERLGALSHGGDGELLELELLRGGERGERGAARQRGAVLGKGAVREHPEKGEVAAKRGVVLEGSIPSRSKSSPKANRPGALVACSTKSAAARPVAPSP